MRLCAVCAGVVLLRSYLGALHPLGDSFAVFRHWIALGLSGAAALALLRGATAVVGMDLSLEALPLEEDPHVTCFLANTQNGNTSGSSDSDVLAEGDSFEGRRRLSTQLGPHQEELVQHADVLVLSPGVPPKKLSFLSSCEQWGMRRQ